MRRCDRSITMLLAVAPLCVLVAVFTPQRAAATTTSKQPNILLCISDDQSWLHAGAYGDTVVKTPNFDRLARQGVRFTHAFCAAPTCMSSRSALLTGRHIWQLEEGAYLWSTLRAKFKTYPAMLERQGYFIGFTGKGWEPGDYTLGGRTRNPAGPSFNKHKVADPPVNAMFKHDYAANFKDFLQARPQGRPFCFWYGSYEPHRPYRHGTGLASGKKLEDVKVPGFLPDTPEVRSDILDYYLEIEWHDQHLGRMLEMIANAGELDNTLIVVTSDNGMPFPRAKATLYDYGVHMPLVICWPARIPGGRVVDDLVSLVDLAPTFLEAVGLDVPAEMTGRSLHSVLQSDRSGRVDESRDCAFAAMERHAWCRPGGLSYPMRSIRTPGWLYIRNYEPGRWASGNPDFVGPLNIYGEIDGSPSKDYMIKHKDDPQVAQLFHLCFEKRPAAELYNVEQDPYQLNNLAQDPAFAETATKLRARLDKYLTDTNDPRSRGESIGEGFPYTHPTFVPPSKRKTTHGK